MMDEWGYGYSAGGMMVMGLFWILVVVGTVALVMYLTRSSRPAHSTDVMEVLKARYAKGEIERAEFEEKRKDLKD